MFDKTDQMAVDTIRTLSIDGVQAANSGHPGLPMGAAPMAYTLWTRHLNVNPKNSRWFNRDRFVLSAGHGSMLLYSLLHLSGYNVSIDDLKNFRQLGGITPGHPEVHITDGVEATTGPLGQGVANAVGMAMAEAHLSATYNKGDYNIVDHYTYALCGDGDLQEGVSQEAASLAGHLKLGKLIMLYDSNNIQLDGPTSKAFTENVGMRFEAYGWEHILVEDGNDLEAIDAAITKAKESTDKPTLIEIKTVIGFGAPNAGTHNVHGAPLGPEGVKAAKKAYGWEGEDFYVPEEVTKRFKEHMIDKGQELEDKWNSLLDEYRSANGELANQFDLALSGELPEGWDAELPSFSEEDGADATRNYSGKVLNAIAKAVPNFWGGSADLSGSNKTMISGVKNFQAGQYDGRNIWYGVREFAMAAALNGILLHGGTKSYVATFFVFTDYLRPAVRLAALSEIPAIYVMTHDSIAVGEDGPTHEPVEQLSSFRGMHNLTVLRPADGNEVAAAWEIAVTSTNRPTMLVLTRQNLPVLPGTKETARQNVKKGAYVLSPSENDTPDGILIATGSEVTLAVEAQKELKAQGHDVSVVSMPSFDLFELQSEEYKESVLPAAVKNRVAIEMGSPFGWHRYAGPEGSILAIDKFGASGNGEAVVEAYGFTSKNVVNTYLSMK
ncbi:transketolase [Alkalibacterium thalassium]|uniref:Transketolase n=1 Tax=Alkalibacterium thalassium TaxID=426701 RepID=A0A1G8VWH4_9LACT|nr:transketolase [Alkalibacterium thalassium]SDJ70349.1 transketolase [Alkalibacterium thalassium]